MSKDLEEQLDEMGPEYRAVVMRLCRAETAPPQEGKKVSGGGSVSLPHGRRWLVAASLILLVGLGVFFQTSRTSRTSRTFRTSRTSRTSSRGAHEYQMDVPEMIATQNPDGSWKNDFLTRRNAAALKLCSDPAAQIAYKKAARNLRLRGVL